MKDGIIIFARFSSDRLYGKVLKNITGKPLLGRVIDRARCAGHYKVVVATSKNNEDKKIYKDFIQNKNFLLIATNNVEELNGINTYQGPPADISTIFFLSELK